MTKKDFTIVPFTERWLGPVVDLLNEAIQGRRMAAPVSADDVRQRVLEHPGFDPAGLLLAVDGDGVLSGAVHAVLPPVSIPQYARLAGRSYIFGPYVRLPWRRQGIGRALLDAAEAYVRPNSETAYIHGLRSPFYHTQEGPRQPFFGSTEVMGLTLDDMALLDFYAKAGYVEKAEQEVSMTALLRPLEPSTQIPEGHELIRVTPQNPWEKPVAWGTQTGYGYDYQPVASYDTIAIIRDTIMVGHCQWYPMRKPGRAVLFDLRLDASLHGYGVGRVLLEGALSAMWESGYTEVELHTSPQRNAVAYQMYKRRGFRDVAKWIMLEKVF